jgi:hypothetical protein
MRLPYSKSILTGQTQLARVDNEEETVMRLVGK